MKLNSKLIQCYEEIEKNNQLKKIPSQPIKSLTRIMRLRQPYIKQTKTNYKV